MNELDGLILTTALAGAFINLLISTLSTRRDLYAGLYAAVAFGGEALLLALIAVIPGMAGAGA